MQSLDGNTQGLAASDKKLLDRIFRRRVDPHHIVGGELANLMCQASHEIGRQIGIFVDRRGNIINVIVGDQQKLYLPDVGRLRASEGRLRGIRLVHTHLKAEPLTRDDLVDLAKLRLDLVAAIMMTPMGEAGPLSAAHLVPTNPENKQWQLLAPVPAATLQRGDGPDFMELVTALEAEFAAKTTHARAVDSGKDRAVLVQVQTRRMQQHEADTRLYELKELARTADVVIVDTIRQKRPELDPRYLVGKGKVEELVIRALQDDATMLVFDHDLLPAQARTISDATELKVIDRTMLILDIFAQHAHSKDGKLQVELAQLKYTLPRLSERNTMMSRLTGGIGGRGPGETKLEVDRRRARDRVVFLERQIDQLAKQRGERRSRRVRSDIPIVSIVGYTNAGKSTLLNTLTKGDVLVENKLFATLDPTSRRLRFPSEREIILTDTVGFIRDLPKDLVAAFRATLEELDEADLMLQIVDASDPAREQQITAVERILVDLDLSEKPRLIVYNKVDRLNEEQLVELAQSDRPHISISAMDETTLTPLLKKMERMLWQEDKLLDAPQF